ncbi:hypothetical protein Pan241w_52830 [Gimesia alba]|uniref:Uncharacterized protein n=1 Tax=Gimesia alba TaxID=2527973 RepID=A0A517RMS5_9PLAN|nr:hypothetical protein [Gimesia alba]QDT45164.1 hypothetical protein Pan241w_52830 [Gimesia alba]
MLIKLAIASAQMKQEKTRPAVTKYLIRGMMQPNCAGLGKLLIGDSPTDEKAWDTTACQVSYLNEMSVLMMPDGRCPDGT